MSELTIHLPEPTAEKLKAYLADKDEDQSAFVAQAIEDTLADRVAWEEHLARLDRGYADAMAGRGKDIDQAFADIRARIQRELKL